MAGERGVRQRRVLAVRDNPEELVAFKVFVPDRLRTKAHAVAARLNISTSAYLEALLEAAVMPDELEQPLPLSTETSAA